MGGGRKSWKGSAGFASCAALTLAGVCGVSICAGDKPSRLCCAGAGASTAGFAVADVTCLVVGSRMTRGSAPDTDFDVVAGGVFGAITSIGSDGVAGGVFGAIAILSGVEGVEGGTENMYASTSSTVIAAMSVGDSGTAMSVGDSGIRATGVKTRRKEGVLS